MTATRDLPPLRERERELELLDLALDSAGRGTGRAIVVEGPAGIGKTRLLAATRHRAAELAMRVLTARAHELERDFTFGVVRQLYEPTLATATDDERELLLEGAAALVPELVAPVGPVPAADPESTFARLHALYWLFANLARTQPLLVVVDDAQWADEPSLQFLGFLARRVHELALALVIGARSPRGERQRMLIDLMRDPATTRVRPGPLSAVAIGDWIAEDTGRSADAAFTQACRESTGGNPFLVRELLLQVRDDQLVPHASAAEAVRRLGPDGVASAVLSRLAQLPAGAAPLARSLAVLDDAPAPGLAARLAGLDEAAATHAAQELVRADVLEPGSTWRFVHPIVRAAIVRELPPAEREALHMQAAQLLRDEGQELEQIAAHLLAVETPAQDWMIETLRSAAAQALSRGGASTAARYLRRALRGASAGQRGAVVAALGEAEALAGDRRAAGHLERAIQLARQPRDAGEIALTLGRLLRLSNQPADAVRTLEAALELDLGDDELHGQLETELLALAYLNLSARELLSERIASIAEPRGAPSAPRDAFGLAALAFESVAACRPAERAVELARRALSPEAAYGNPMNAGTATAIAAGALVFCDQFDAADRVYDLLLGVARKQGWVGLASSALSLRAMSAFRRGALDDADADADGALDPDRGAQGTQALIALGLAAKHYVAAERVSGRESLEALLSQEAEEHDPDNLPYGQLLHSRARLRAASGDLPGALADLLAVGERERAWENNPAIVWWRSDAALVQAQLGEQLHARALAYEELELARTFGAPRALGIALRAVGVTETGSAALRALREAVEVLEQSPAELELARALTDLGATVRRTGRASASREPLRRGHELARRCGATLLAERAFSELLAAGARPRRTALSGVDSLTPAERRVAGMASEGMTNREIAQALFVTEKTIQTHLGHAYTKLEISSRAELPAKLAREPDRRLRGDGVA